MYIHEQLHAQPSPEMSPPPLSRAKALDLASAIASTAGGNIASRATFRPYDRLAEPGMAVNRKVITGKLDDVDDDPASATITH